MSCLTIGEGGDTTIPSPDIGLHDSPFRVYYYMIPYMAGKLAPDPTHSIRGLVKYVPGRGYFHNVPSQNGDNLLHSRPPPNR